MVAVPGPFHAHLVGHVHGKLAGGYRFGKGVADGKRELFGGHLPILGAYPCSLGPVSDAAAHNQGPDHCE